MARARRAVENVAVLVLSLAISGLMFGWLMTKVDDVGGHSGKGLSVITRLVPEVIEDDAATTSVETAPSVSVAGNPGDSVVPSASHLMSDESHPQAGDYLPASLLTQRPVVLYDIDPELPESLQGLRVQSVELLLLIDEYGDVDRVQIESLTDLTHTQADELLRHFQVMRFMPGRLHDRAVRSALRIRVQLHP
jgi:hypothetical protein